MDITTMGERIKELRKGAGLTQEELGNRIGVTAQAVSKWECGSVPDTELIPKIADCFNVPIDALFGREYNGQDVYTMMSKHIIEGYQTETGEDEVLRRAFSNCYLTFLSAYDVGWPYERDKEEWTKTKVDEGMANKDYSEIFSNKLLAFMDRSEEMPFFLFMPEAENRGKKLLENTDYVSFFAALGDPDFFHAVIYLFSHKNSRFTKGRLISNLGLTEERTDEILAMLQKFRFIIVRELELDETVINTYSGNWIPYFIMMLQCAYYLQNQPKDFYGSITSRSNPLLNLDD